MTTFARPCSGLTLVLVTIALSALPTEARGGDPATSFTDAPAPFGPGGRGADDDLVLDDGTAEGVFGVGLTTARPFLWLNHFTPPPAGFVLEAVEVLFPAGANMAVGNGVDVVIYADDDGLPTNGATLLRTIPGTVRELATGFSTFPVEPPVAFLADQEILIGVVNRFTVAGTDTPTSPAALDTSSSQGRSWFATWTGDPPDPPTLPSDARTDLVDSLQPGNWMIRAVGGPPSVPVPALGTASITLLALLLALAALGALRIRSSELAERAR